MVRFREKNSFMTVRKFDGTPLRRSMWNALVHGVMFLAPSGSPAKRSSAGKAISRKTVRRRRAAAETLRCSTLPPTLRDEALRLSELSPQQRMVELAQLGRALAGTAEELPLASRLAERRVHGCASVIYIEATTEDDSSGLVRVRGSSDASITAGLVRVLASTLSGRPRDEVMRIQYKELAAAMQLGSFLVESRANAFENVLRAVKSQLSAAGGEFVETGAHERAEASEKRRLSDARTLLTDAAGPEVAVLLSGGVDSSVSLNLLLQQGYRPRPYYLKIWLEDELAHLGQCPWEEDLSYATAVCDKLGLRLESVPLQKEYHDEVVQYTIKESRAGRTPNPDVMCNSRIKFGVALQRFGREYEHVATGHYANTRRDESSGLTQLVCSTDDFKDQTYFLAHLRQDQISKALFPIGAYTKTRVRELARELDLPNQARRDSQGLCFLGKLPFDSFLQHYLGRERGAFVEYETGVELGRHRGFWFYTLGQRKGLGLSGGPWFVVSKDVESNVVYLSRNYVGEDKPRNAFRVEALSWISGSAPPLTQLDNVLVKVRHGPNKLPARVELDGRDGSARTARVLLAQGDQVGLAPGQYAVFYAGDACLGAGVIAYEAALSSAAPERKLPKSAKRLQAHYIE